LKMMQHAARAHWRAAAWLLERTDPAYAKRPLDAASPNQFHAGLEFVMEAALAAIPPELHEQVYEYMTAAAEEAFACLFPNFGRWGDAKRPKLPPTPLVQQQFRHRCTDPKFTRVVAEHEHGNISETVPPQLPAHLQPRALPGGRSSRRAGAVHPPSPPAAHGPVPQEHREANPPSPWTQRPGHKAGDGIAAFRESRLREVRTVRPIASRRPNVSRYNHRLLSPKTRFTTKRTPNDTPQNNAPVSREAVAERAASPRRQTSD
jgi:hypothetical protein